MAAEDKEREREREREKEKGEREREREKGGRDRERDRERGREGGKENSFSLPSRPPPKAQPLPTSSTSSTKTLNDSNFYPPTSASFSLPPQQLPPLIVKIHGGPTSQAPASFSLDIAFWTSRGFAVADLNYRGSSGYGRAFRKALAGEWGVVDVEDVANAAKYLAEEGLVDAGKLMVTGGSAGG